MDETVSRSVLEAKLDSKTCFPSLTILYYFPFCLPATPLGLWKKLCGLLVTSILGFSRV